MIQDIVNSINSTISGCLSVEDSAYYNIAKVVEVNEKRYPTSAANGKIFKICPDDGLNLQVYHKVSSFNSRRLGFEGGDGKSFGRRYTYEVISRASMIVVMKSALSEVNPSYIPENFGLLLPEGIKLPDYNSINIEYTSTNTDHDTIVRREWKEIPYSKHKCKFLVFETNYNIRAITCKLSCASFLLYEDDYKVLQEDGSAILLS